MITEPIGNALHLMRASFEGPIILTLRSSDEGGAYAGGTGALWDRIQPYLTDIDMVDLEIRFSEHAGMVRSNNKKVIASCHLNRMPEPDELASLMETLHEFGDIIKVAVQPQNHDDVLTLIKSTLHCPYPVITSVTGTLFRYTRPLLCLFGSLYTYCYIDSATSPGQYSIKEMHLLSHLLTPGFVDPWFEGRPVRSGDATEFIRRSQEYHQIQDNH